MSPCCVAVLGTLLILTCNSNMTRTKGCMNVIVLCTSVIFLYDPTCYGHRHNVSTPVVVLINITMITTIVSAEEVFINHSPTSWRCRKFWTKVVTTNRMLPENPDRRSASPSLVLRSLTPRLPTTGEEIFDAGKSSPVVLFFCCIGSELTL